MYIYITMCNRSNIILKYRKRYRKYPTRHKQDKEDNVYYLADVSLIILKVIEKVGGRHMFNKRHH